MCTNSWFIESTYDQGSDYYAAFSSTDIRSHSFPNVLGGKTFVSRDSIILALTTILSVISFTIALGERIKLIINKKNRTKFVLNLKDEIRMARNALRDNMSSQILTSYTWDSIPDYYSKIQIIKDQHDYIRINNFYNKLKERNIECSQNPPKKDRLKRYNQICLNLSTAALQINWQQYADIRQKPISLDLFKTVPAIIVASILYCLFQKNYPDMYLTPPYLYHQ